MDHANRTGEAAGASARPGESPILSLLVPVYNVERYLEESLASACAQSLADIEIVCIDDGSTDGSVGILRAHAARDARIRVISKENTGYGDSMNRGLAAARGEFVGILEPDDLACANGLRALVTAARKTGADLAKGNFERYWSAPRVRTSPVQVVPADRCGEALRPRDDAAIFSCEPSIWSAVYRRSFLEDNGIRFLPTPGASFQDCSFAFKVLASAERAVYVNETVVRYRQDNEGSSVKAADKAFCTCGEYAEIERWIGCEFAARHGEAEAARLLRAAQVAKYDSYMWSYVRLAPELRAPFLDRMAREFAENLDAQTVSLADFRPWKRANLEAIVRDPELWLARYPSYATAGPLGRMVHYLRLGGPGLVASYALGRLSHG